MLWKRYFGSCVLSACASVFLYGCGSGGTDDALEDSVPAPVVQSSVQTSSQIPSSSTGSGRLFGITIQGEGQVQASTGFSCTATCSQTVASSVDSLTLQAEGRLGYQFLRWSSGCETSASQCVVDLSEVDSVTAVFVRDDEPTIDYYRLINANTGESIPGFDPFPQNAVIDLKTLPTRNLTLVAEPWQQVSSIRFNINNGELERIERTPPFSLYGDQGGAPYLPWRFDLGEYRIQVTPYSGENATGIAGNTDTLDFRLVEFIGSLSKSTLSFTATSGQMAPAVQFFDIVNSGNIDGRFEITGAPNWLQLSQTQGNLNAESKVSISVSPSACSQVAVRDAELIIRAGAGPDISQQQFSISISYSCNNGSARYDYALERFYFNQAVPAMDSAQLYDEQIRVIAGRPGIARAFVTASGILPPTPKVNLVWRDANGSSGALPMTAPTLMRTNLDEGEKNHTFNLELDGQFFVAGREFYVVIDPDNTITENNETNNHYPPLNNNQADYLPLKHINVPTHRVTFVPVTIGNETPNLNTQTINNLYRVTQKLSPIADFELDIRSQPYTYTGSGGWVDLLGEIELLRRQDGARHYYFALTVSGPDPETRIAGIAYLGGKSALSLLNDDVIAHEFGHNFSLDHAPCGTSGDPRYPYPNAAVNIFGYDIFSGDILTPDRRDYMSYCNYNWVSDWSFNKMMAYQGGVTSNYVMQNDYHDSRDASQKNDFLSGEDNQNSTQGALYISGNFKNDKISIDQYFPIIGIPDKSSGSYSLKLYDNSDFLVVEHDFNLLEIDHAPEVKHFSITVALSSDIKDIAKLEIENNGKLLYQQTQKDKIRQKTQTTHLTTAHRLTEDTVFIQWDDLSYDSAIIVDEETGLTLAMDKTGAVTVTSSSDNFRMIYNQGLKTDTEIIAVLGHE